MDTRSREAVLSPAGEGTNLKLKTTLWLALPVLLGAGSVVAAVFISRPQPTKITTVKISGHSENGSILSGASTASHSDQLATSSQLVYQSAEIISPKPKSNAAVLKWNQSDTPGQVSPAFRVYDGRQWSSWVESDNSEERKDGTSASHTAMVLSTSIHKVQYRLTVTAENGMSPAVDLKSASIELVDSTQGPSPTKVSLVAKILDKFGIAPAASAHADGPRIISRAEWGCPEPNSSDKWDLEYRKIDRAIVHHTVTAFSPDPAATIRAIWQYHTFTQDWGDIGYNYLVDPAGNIYQGRYFEPSVAETTRTDIVGGHAYGWNYGTTGIAAIGDFTKVRPSAAMLKSIGDIIAFKLHRYDRDPTGWFGEWPVVMGHRDIGTTSCPGSAHLDLPSIRTLAAQQIWHYRLVDHYDAGITSQGADGIPGSVINLVSGASATAYLDFRNAGIDTWGTVGATPVRLGADQPRDRVSSFADSSWINPNRPSALKHKVTGYNSDGTATLAPASLLLPGETGRFEFGLKAPSTPGSYVEHFQLVADGNSWFIRDFNVSFRINVSAPTYIWHGLEQSIFTDTTKTQPASLQNLQAGDRVYAVVKAQNTGNLTWTNSGPNPTRLGTYRSSDRASAMCDPSWTLGCTRPATLVEASVAPGDTGTFEFWLKAPAVAQDGQIREYFNLVTEGRSWLQDLGLYWEFGIKASVTP